MRARGTLSEDGIQRAKAKLIDTQPSSPLRPPPTRSTRLRRSRSDKWLGGVCAGLGAVRGIEAWIWRLMFVLLLMFGGVGVLVVPVVVDLCAA